MPFRSSLFACPPWRPVLRLLAGLAPLWLGACASTGGIELPGLTTSQPGVTDEPPADEQAHAQRTRAQFSTHFAGLTGGGVRSQTPAGAPKAAGTDSHAVVKVFFATDRTEVKTEANKIYFGSGRGPVTYGQAYVSIPRDHRMGKLEQPSVWRFWNTADPDKFVVLLSAAKLGQPAYLAQVQGDVRTSRRRDALVFVHGFNVSFEDAARRTAQMKYDLGFEGPAVFYSWPSLGQVSGYKADLAAVNESVAGIRAFLTDIGRQSGAQTIYLVAHSMGNVGLLTALSTMTNTERARVLPRFREIVLAAPDIDRDVFLRDIAPRIVSARNRVTLYASANDRALQVSEQINKDPRLGDTKHGIALARGLDTVDASGVDTSLVGHAYYAENRSIMSDMYYLFQQAAPPDRRFGLERVEVTEGIYWRFKR